MDSYSFLEAFEDLNETYDLVIKINDFIVKQVRGKYIVTKYIGNKQNVVIPDNIVVIDSFAFADCTSLISITIPEGVERIEDHAFYKCSNLTSVIFKGNRILSYDRGFGEGTFEDCDRLKSITFNGTRSLW